MPKILPQLKRSNWKATNWVIKVQAFEFDIEYVKGKKNVVADALSIIPSISLMDVAEDWKVILGVELRGFIGLCT